MIITKTPYRISFFGGGSDYPSWYKKMVEQYYQPQLINIYIYPVAFLQIILKKNIELFGERLKMFKELIK